MPDVIGAIRDKWLGLGGAGGPMGNPLNVELPTFDGIGRSQEFQGGTISWHPQLGAFAVWGLIRDRWFALGREQYGYPVTDELGCPDGRGRFNHFRAMHLPGNPEASIYWTPETGAQPVYGDIRRKWSELGWENSPLGYPVAGEEDCGVGGGRKQMFERGVAMFHPAHGTFIVYGSILAAWGTVGSEQFGYPVTDELGCPDGRGRFNHFRAMHLPGNPEASIYWTPETGAQPVYGDIRRKWSELGWENSPLGYPVAGEEDCGVGGGRKQGFEHGVAMFHPAHGTFVVYGLILVAWGMVGSEQFGYPITDELGCPDGRGRFNHFRAMHLPGNPEASIYWTPETGAQPVYGDIRRKWSELGWENSPLGYPVAMEGDCSIGGGRKQGFERGIAMFHPAHGTFILYGSILATWGSLGGEGFGYPITDELGCPDGRGRYNHFRAMHLSGNPDASIYWTPETGAHPVYGGIRDRWARRGWERSEVGYPIEAEHDLNGGPGREQKFEQGRIIWHPETGALFDPLVLSTSIVSGGLAALGGWANVSVNSDGSTRWQGHAHNSGADGYDFGLSAVVRASSGRALAFAHTGHVGGTFTSGSRDDNWDEHHPVNPMVVQHIAAFNDGQMTSHLEYSSDIGDFFESTVSWLVKFGVGSLLGPVGAVVFVGMEIGSLISTGSLVPGARLAEGILWMAGPANTLFAIAAEGIAQLGSKTRDLSQEEYDWANNEVFSGSLPPRDRLVLTDTLGGGDRAFTFPRFDGKITLNMGPAAFADPRHYPGGKPGETFIHELVHAWQLHHTPGDLAYLADAFSTKVCEATGGHPYSYGPAGPAYGDFNLEQQAQVISDWFAGNSRDGANQTGIAKDINSPYFRYVNDNIRVGNTS